MDADSTIGPRFVETAVAHLDRDPRIGAIGGVFYGEQPCSLIEQAQANEYIRYSRRIAQKRGRVAVLTGTAAMFRHAALQQLEDTRGFVYDPTAITEDNEITLALKTLGWKLLSPQRCTVQTELMPSFKALHGQRLRWYRGALDNLVSYGWTKVTRRYWMQQVGLAMSTMAMLSYFIVMTWGTALGRIHFSWFWTLVGIGFASERVITTWRGGWRGRIFAALLIPEMIYDMFLQACFLQAVYTKVTHRPISWGRITPKEMIPCTEPERAQAVP
jgi:cellulose synthase/poly-beta-1,6-N-acetylglucosamine synthase-like glycosyltransferase